MDIHVHRIWSEEAYSTGVVARGYAKNGDYPRWTEKVKIQDLGIKYVCSQLCLFQMSRVLMWNFGIQNQKYRLEMECFQTEGVRRSIHVRYSEYQLSI